jgi:hypothetical protein
MSTISKFLPLPPDGFSTQIASSTVATDALTVTLDSTSGLPTEGIGQFFKKDSNGDLVAGSVEFVHWTNVSGNTITFSDTDDRGITGSDSGAQAYVADDYFEVWASSYYVAYGGLVEHDADGTHGAITPTSVTTNVIAGSSQFPDISGIKDLGTVGATETVNWNNGDRQKMTLDENLTITFSNAAEGQTLTLYMLQDGSGTNTITWADSITWADGATWSTSLYTTTADKMNIVVVTYVGGTYFGLVSKFA